jgi:dienelactone hydrolase
MPRLDDWSFRLLRLVGPYAPRVRRYRTVTLPGGGNSTGHRRAGWDPSGPLQIAVHPAGSDRLVVINPGLNATIEGEGPRHTRAHPDRYRRIARRLQSGRVAAVLRTANPCPDYGRYGERALDRLRRAIGYGQDHAGAICGVDRPELCLMGFSAGAGAVAALASEFQPKRMLLVAPSGDVGPGRIIGGLKDYAGELLLMVGEEDEVVGRDAACLFDELSPAACRKQVLYVPGCDHCFTGDDHDALLEETAFRAFQGGDILAPVPPVPISHRGDPAS